MFLLQTNLRIPTLRDSWWFIVLNIKLIFILCDQRCTIHTQYDAKISPTDGQLYDSGVMLTPDGRVGRHDYMAHACRGTYTLHSLYLLLWANFGSFCIALLTQPEAESYIHGNLISKQLPIRHFCVSQLQAMWVHIRNNLNLSEEERSFFVTSSMWKFYQVFNI